MATFQFPPWASRGSVFAPLATETSVLYQSWREEKAHPTFRALLISWVQEDGKSPLQNIFIS